MKADDLDFENLKGRLLARSDLHRQALAAEFQRVSDSLAWLPRSVELAKAASPYVAVAVPIGWALLRRRHRHEARQTPAREGRRFPLGQAASLAGLVAKAWRGYQVFQQVWPVVRGFRKSVS